MHMGGFGSAKGSNSSQSYIIENIHSSFSLPLFPILIKSPYYSVTLKISDYEQNRAPLITKSNNGILLPKLF